MTKQPSTAKTANLKSSAQSTKTSDDPWRGKAVEKADNLFRRIFRQFEPDHVEATAEAKAKARVFKARSKAKSDIINAMGARAVDCISNNSDLTKSINQYYSANFARILDHASHHLAENSHSSLNKAPTDDFLLGFYEDSKTVCDEDLQSLWGKILADEVTHPGSFHPQTRVILKSITKEDAEIFTKLCSFGLERAEIGAIVFDHNHEIYTKNSINYNSLSSLEELGLIRQSTSIFTIDDLPQNFFVNYFNETLYFSGSSEKFSLPIGTVVFSRAGRQLSRLANPKAIGGFVEYIISEWSKRNIVVCR